MANMDGIQRSLVTLQPGQAPTVTFTDPRVKASGSLSSLVPDTAILKLYVDRPSAADAGTVECQVVGLGKDGNVLKQTQTLPITVHPEAGLVDQELKAMVADLKREADALLDQTVTLRKQNQHLTRLHADKAAALKQKKSDLQSLKAQRQSLEKTVEGLEQSLRDSAQKLMADIGKVSTHAPARRVAFNALQTTERVYASGAQIEFHTVEMNEGGGYNSSTSIFRAPVEGMYYLTSAQLAHDIAGSAAIRTYSIQINSTVIGGADNRDDSQSSTYKQSSASALYHLGPYDIIRVYQTYSSDANSALSPYSNTPDGRSTNFAGYLVK
ncbi:hypothetical protein ACOMHN_019913 [Nucella lapillus]